MKQKEIEGRWREHLVNGLRDRYGLAEDEARAKADMFLHWIEQTSGASAPGFPFSQSKAQPPVKRHWAAAPARKTAI